MKILVLGKTGMFGHIAFDYLRSTKKYEVYALGRDELDVTMSDQEIERIIKKYHPDYIINAIGLINKSPELNEINARIVNSNFPHLLAYFGMKNKFRLIHVSTDCYLDEDIYGKSKYLGEVNDRHNLTIRTSIIGPELKENGYGLFNWFMTQKDKVNGFIKGYWDGVTTLQLAKFMELCIDQGNLCGIIDYRTKLSQDKYSLLKLIVRIFNKEIEIMPDDKEMKDKRNPKADFWCYKTYTLQLKELREYMKNDVKYKRYFE